MREFFCVSRILALLLVLPACGGTSAAGGSRDADASSFDVQAVDGPADLGDDIAVDVIADAPDVSPDLPPEQDAASGDSGDATADPRDTPLDVADSDSSSDVDGSDADADRPDALADVSDMTDDVTSDPVDATVDSADAGSDMLDVAEDVLPDAPDVFPGLQDEALLAAIHDDLAASHIVMTYGEARDEMYAIGGIDDHDGRVEGVYTGRTVVTDGTRVPSTDCRLIDGTPDPCAFNTEHTWPRSKLHLYLGDGTAIYNTAEADIHHIFPSEQRINGARGSMDFGDTDCDDSSSCTVNDQSLIGLRVGAVGDSPCFDTDPGCVMDVRPLRFGDVARAQFYMAARYDMPIDPLVEDTLRIWHGLDPPDDRERARNTAIEAVQGNRNPFVDNPSLVDRISDF